MAGNSLERQEAAFLKAVSSAVRTNKGNPVSIIAGSQKIASVQNARKYTGRQYSGNEAYPDIILSPKAKKEIKLSLKGERTPSLVGGGEKGIETILPGFTNRFMKKALSTLLNMGYEEGDKIPDVFCKVEPTQKKKLVEGSPAMGGPIDYVYMGPMNIDYEYDANRNLLYMSGDFLNPEQFAKSFDMHVRLRARREDQRFDPNAQIGGVPRIYGRSSTGGEVSGRLVITDEVPMDAIIIRI